ncbi:DUF418 domain-containing protein [Egibacter rhizosphaerae]|uniref:DUF418 domain-containing protein n=1 Tax=Egibacter rhizosphaerae TaxID=1670831 RepID=A0A411YAT4_9ACTN|nr:acyltransferase family protein [Egibacter rhizosphaerae]QBI18330.1 DUF418 domain-containing protein [Egibacter rhizosphaerae]
MTPHPHGHADAGGPAPPTAWAPSAATSQGARLRGIDAARALAIAGMFAVHIGPTDAEGAAGTAYALPHGRAAVLFGLLAGVGVTLLARARSATPARSRLRLAWRAAILLPLGLALQTLDHNVLVILQDYAVLFLLGIVVLGLRDRWLLLLAAASTLLGPVLNLWGQREDPETFARQTIEMGDPPLEILHGLVLSGPYPLVTWAAPFLIGMWLARRPLNQRRLQLWLAVGAVAVTGAAQGIGRLAEQRWGDVTESLDWDHLWALEPHGQMPLWIIDATASAVLVLALLLLVADLAPRAVWPLTAAGQLALTVYVGHLLALHEWFDELTADEVGPAAARLAAGVLLSIAIAVAWRAVFPRGPLEAVLHAPWTLTDRWRRTRSDA